jgi:hypothetical protein
MPKEHALTPETMLALAPRIRTRLDALGHVLVDSPVGTIVDIGPKGFRILSLFSEPLTLGDAIERLEHEHRCSTDFAPTMTVINMLTRRARSSRHKRVPRGGAAGPIRSSTRACSTTTAGRATMWRRWRPDDVVLDIGTGSGVLAVAAARAGARRVYAVEASDTAEVAARVFEVNGVQDKVTYEVLTGDFYDRLGYRTVGVIEDCAAGTTTRWYQKDL